MWQDAAQLKVKTLEENLEKAKVDEAKTSQKLQSFQQVNRSQTCSRQRREAEPFSSYRLLV